MEYCIEEFKSQHNIDVDTLRKKAQLRKECTQAKITLSEKLETEIEVAAFNQEEDYTITLTRAKLEELCEPLFQRCIPPLEQVLADANVFKD